MYRNFFSLNEEPRTRENAHAAALRRKVRRRADREPAAVETTIRANATKPSRGYVPLDGFVVFFKKDFRRRPALPRIASAVPSALEGLTAGFGMEPGMTPPQRPPKIQTIYPTRFDSRIVLKESPKKRGKGLGVLVPVGSTPRGAHTSGLSIP